jgi:aerobic carbon-monoxide dehydrogenase medium subunit
MKFEVLEPRTLDEAVFLLGKAPEETRVIAGGQSLLLMIRSGLVMPRFLLSLNNLKELSEITLTPEKNVYIGATVTHRELLNSQLLSQQAAILLQAAFRIGSTPVRNFGTLGGNLCHNEMGSDPPPALLALNASVECVSSRGKRKLPLADLLTDYFETSLRPDEILIDIEIPSISSNLKTVYLKHTFRSGDLALVGVAAMASMRDSVCDEMRLALGGVGPVPFRAIEAEKLARQRKLDKEVIEEVAVAAADASDPISDAHASADYRKKMARVFVRRALQGLTSAGEHA